MRLSFSWLCSWRSGSRRGWWQRCTSLGISVVRRFWPSTILLWRFFVPILSLCLWRCMHRLPVLLEQSLGRLWSSLHSPWKCPLVQFHRCFHLPFLILQWSVTKFFVPPPKNSSPRTNFYEKNGSPQINCAWNIWSVHAYFGPPPPFKHVFLEVLMLRWWRNRRIWQLCIKIRAMKRKGLEMVRYVSLFFYLYLKLERTMYESSQSI